MKQETKEERWLREFYESEVEEGGRPMTREEFERRDKAFWERIKTPIPLAKPKVAVLTVPVPDDWTRVDPASIRVHGRRDDGVVVMARPPVNPLNVTVKIELVREVDAEGRPVWPTAEAKHEYNPLDALKR
jgi:hypothetical protein